jgi:beta-1,4-N-acetylglucosaminyltransferase
MIKVFITVGTTPFDKLIRICDLNLDPGKFQCIAQVSEFSSYLPKNIEVFPFINDVSLHLKSADLIISHAGAGNVYSILEKHLKVIFVPNNTLKDGHQEDICRFIEENHFASVYRLNSNESLTEKIGYTITEKFQIYTNDKTDDLVHSIYQILKRPR